MADWTDEVKGRLGFGFMRLPGGGGRSGYAEIRKMVDSFMEAGFNYFDTAHVYHGGKSETALRDCLVRRYPRDSFFLTDKLSTENFICEDQIDRLLQRELDALGVDHLDMLLLHAQNAPTYEKYMRCHAYEHAAAFKAAGKTRHVGISFHDTAELLDRILTEHPELEAVQIQFNYADLDNAAIQSRACYETCVRHNVPCIVMEPIRGGSLANLPPEAQLIVDSLPNPEGLSNAGLALRFVASFPNNRMILSGMSTLEQMQENLRTMADPKPLTNEQMAGLAKVHGVFQRLGMIECTACHYCTDGCPKKIMIPELFAALNNQRVFGGWSSSWYYRNALTTDGHGRARDCVRCGLCEKACPQKLPIRELMQEVSREFD